MQNRESLAHALQGEAKREYNKKYYEENSGYWPEWRRKNAISKLTGQKDDEYVTGGVSSNSKLKDAIARLKTSSPASRFYNEYYKNREGAIRPDFSNMARNAMTRKIEEVEEKQRLEHEKQIRIRNRIASVYKLEWAEAQERAKRLPNRIINSVKKTIESAKNTFLDAIRLGKK